MRENLTAAKEAVGDVNVTGATSARCLVAKVAVELHRCGRYQKTPLA